MCDFRDPPRYYNGEEVEYRGHISMNEWGDAYWREADCGKYEKGCYCVCATGSFYDYFDGERFVGYDEAYKNFKFEGECHE